MESTITCVSVGCYEYALTRGKQYDILAHKNEKEQVKVRGDNERTRWYPSSLFDLAGGSVPILLTWRFDRPVQDAINQWDETNNWVEIRMAFSDGTERWCSLTTPDYLGRLLEPRSDPSRWSSGYEPSVCSAHLIVIRDLTTITIGWVLRHLDQHNELLQHSCPCQ